MHFMSAPSKRYKILTQTFSTDIDKGENFPHAESWWISARSHVNFLSLALSVHLRNEEICERVIKIPAALKAIVGARSCSGILNIIFLAATA